MKRESSKTKVATLKLRPKFHILSFREKRGICFSRGAMGKSRFLASLGMTKGWDMTPQYESQQIA
jgi:hypothetical protein